MLLNGEDKETWTGSLTNELGRLVQGIGKNRPSDKKVYHNCEKKTNTK